MRIKDGLKEMSKLVALIARDHSLVKEKKVRYQDSSVMTDEANQVRRRDIRQRLQALLMRIVVLLASDDSNQKQL